MSASRTPIGLILSHTSHGVHGYGRAPLRPSEAKGLLSPR